MFTVDGIEWEYPCDINRVAEITPSDISGMLMDKTYFNDVLGTYMRYTVKIAVPFTAQNDYIAIYEALTSPVDGHTFVLPYNSSTITITGRVANVNDVYVRMPNGGVYWKGISFEVVANGPSKTMSLSQVITRGRAPLPDAATPSEGDTYVWMNGEWSVTSYEDADDIAY